LEGKLHDDEREEKKGRFATPKAEHVENLHRKESGGYQYYDKTICSTGVVRKSNILDNPEKSAEKKSNSCMGVRYSDHRGRRRISGGYNVCSQEDCDWVEQGVQKKKSS